MVCELLTWSRPVRPRSWSVFGLACLACAQVATAAGRRPGLADKDKDELFGAVVAPATLPAGAASAYGFAGVQEVGVGYRQGVSSIEVEARVKLNYFLLSGAFELLLKHTIASDESGAVAPFLGAGLVHDTGSHYISAVNFQYTAVRALAGVIATYQLGELVSVVGEFDAPLDLSFSPTNGVRFAPLAGGGMEIYVGSDITVLLMGQLGINFVREPLGVPQWGLGYQVRAGLGFRLF